MSTYKSNGRGRTKGPEQSTSNQISERRRRLANRLGHLLARRWLQQRRPKGDSENKPD
jgi:hypothetical protein